MNKDIYQKLIEVINHAITPVALQDDFSFICEKIGDARFVLLGEATHGTHEFYQARMAITRQLIVKKGFMAVAIEGDWPDAYRIHRYLQGANHITAQEALHDFIRFPTWMWRNKTMPPFLNWLHQHNENLSPTEKIGFYGLDLYSLNSSMQAVISYLRKIDPEAAVRAKRRYACFDHMNIDPQAYGYLTSAGIKKACIKESIEQLIELQHHAFEYLKQDGLTSADEYFFATQNARLVKAAEAYYRSIFESHICSWNIRDQHMAETVNILADHLEHRFNKPAKIIIWAHNTHVGDARATEMGERGEVNLGQLIREQHPESTYSIGFSTYEGYVTAASDWDAPVERKKIVSALDGSYESLFHDLQYKNFILDLVGDEQVRHFLKIPRLQRAIGVIYRPETERHSHYFFTHLPYQFNALIHFDKTNELEPLD